MKKTRVGQSFGGALRFPLIVILDDATLHIRVEQRQVDTGGERVRPGIALQEFAHGVKLQRRSMHVDGGTAWLRREADERLLKRVRRRD